MTSSREAIQHDHSILKSGRTSLARSLRPLFFGEDRPVRRQSLDDVQSWGRKRKSLPSSELSVGGGHASGQPAFCFPKPISGMTTLPGITASGTKPVLCVACLVQQLVNCLNVFRQKKQGRRGCSKLSSGPQKRSSKKASNTKNRRFSRVLARKDKANDSSQQRC